MKWILLCALVSLGSSAHADDHPERADLQSGKLFTVQIFPTSKSIEVKVAGNEIAKAEFGDLGFSAQLKVGKKTISLVPVRNGDRFLLSAPATKDASRLRIELKSADKIEEFNFEIPPQR